MLQAASCCAQSQRTAIPKRICGEIRDMWLMQLRLEKTTKQQANKLTKLTKFRAAFDLLALRSKLYPSIQQQVDWWQGYYHATQNQYTQRPVFNKNKGRKHPPKRSKM